MANTTKISAQKIALLERYITMGVPMKKVLDASGVRQTSYYTWLSIGEAIADGDLEHPDVPVAPVQREDESKRKFARRHRRYQEALQLYESLYNRVRKAHANSQINMIAVVRTAAAGGDWRAALAFLERRDPDNWMPRKILQAEITGDIRQQHSIVDPGLMDMMKALGMNERKLSKELEDDLRAGSPDAPGPPAQDE